MSDDKLSGDAAMPGWLTKAEVQQETGLNERTIERLAERGVLRKAYRPNPGHQPTPVYDPESVAALKPQLSSPVPSGSKPAPIRGGKVFRVYTGGRAHDD